MHYTVGTAGSRTTFGIPGTGISYTEVHGAHTRVARRHPAVPVPSREWVDSHRINMTLHTPDRRPGEPPIRPDQLSSIREMLPTMDFSQLKDFGESQADNLIAQISYQKKEVSKTLLKKFYAEHGHAIPDSFIDHVYDHPDQPYKAPKKWGCWTWIVVGIILLALLSILSK
jgi:hypothetical protein